MSNSYFTTSSVAVTDQEWLEVLPADGKRDTLSIQNQGSSVIYVAFDENEDETLAIKVMPNAYFEPFSVPSNSIKLKAEFGGSSTALVVTTHRTTIINY